jgi:hypothetical protein
MTKIIKKTTKKRKLNEVNNSTNKENNTNSENSNNEKNINNINFNKLLLNSFKNKSLKLKKNNSNQSKKHDNYESSFDDINSFRKLFTKSEIDNIDIIIYHDENNDGMFSAAIAYNYLIENNSNKKIELIGEKPGKFNFRNKISGKNILILDLSLKIEYLNEIIKLAKHFIVIDDHSKTLLNNKNIFNGNNHSACGYTWKFFYPKKEIPNTILYIDSSDGKLFLSFIPPSFSTLFAQSTGIRFTHGKSKQLILKKQNGEFFIELWNLINNDTKLCLFIAIGYYYHQFSENLKEQIAINAIPAKFQGYNVGLLNFNSPLLTKPVARQIITNFRNRGQNIDFAVCWGYEHINNSYRIQLIDDHKQTRIRMDEIAKKLGQIGGNPKGGGGHAHVSNFYWPRNSKYDIWDLFTKQFI